MVFSQILFSLLSFWHLYSMSKDAQRVQNSIYTILKQIFTRFDEKRKIVCVLVTHVFTSYDCIPLNCISVSLILLGHHVSVVILSCSFLLIISLNCSVAFCAVHLRKTQAMSLILVCYFPLLQHQCQFILIIYRRHFMSF